MCVTRKSVAAAAALSASASALPSPLPSTRPTSTLAKWRGGVTKSERRAASEAAVAVDDVGDKDKDDDEAETEADGPLSPPASAAASTGGIGHTSASPVAAASVHSTLASDRRSRAHPPGSGHEAHARRTGRRVRPNSASTSGATGESVCVRAKAARAERWAAVRCEHTTGSQMI